MTERPYLGPDETYDKQRRCRLADVVGDYLTDEDCDARRFYEEMLSEINDWIDYHRRFAKKGENMRELMMSGTALSFDQSVKDYSDILTGLDNC
jgi:hypothetical protein